MKKIINITIILLVSLILNMKLSQANSYAGLIKEKNLTIRLDNTEEELQYLNEKIEVYIMKDDKYYSDIELNLSNEYNYRTALDIGTYKFFARVKYDKNEVYKIEVLNDALEINYSNNIRNNIINIRIESVEFADDFHFNLNENSSLDSSIPEYSADDLDKLKEMQKEWEEEIQKSIDELNIWEEENNFITKFGTESDMGPAHYYPDEEDNLSEETISDNIEESIKGSTEFEAVNPTIEDKETEILKIKSVNLRMIIITVTVVSVILILMLIYLKLQKESKDNE